ncbi:MAG: hypothetical protein M1820_002264 [Bogoriella megaspora]|nr:MAG: hypothetical protein M1820_002264 [Bogoriella megaspora]
MLRRLDFLDPLLLKRTSTRGLRAYNHVRELSCSGALWSGHSRWSTIKHDKGKNDAAKNKQRTVLAAEIALASKFYGPDPNSNPRLATIVSTAKKAGFPKASIEAAIARGQGVSTTGAKLENVVVEAILPQSVAVVIDCQTDNKLRTLADVRHAVKTHEGTVTPMSYLFTKAGKIVFHAKDGTNSEAALEAVLDYNILDIYDDDQGRIIMLTEPNETFAVIEALGKAHGLQPESSEIIWEPNEDTMAKLEDEAAAEALEKFIDAVEEVSGVQGVHTNVQREAS